MNGLRSMCNGGRQCKNVGGGGVLSVRGDNDRQALSPLFRARV